MADSAKREKLAAARKKLKQFQQKKSSPAVNEKSEKKSKKSKSNGNVELNGPKNVQNEHGPHGNGNLDLPPKITPQTPASAVKNTPVQQVSRPAVTPQKPAPNPPVGPPPPKIIDTSTKPQSQRLTASTEKLQQLSRQINGLISQSSAYLSNNNETPSVNDSTGVPELEKRNRDLASLLEQHMQLNEQLGKQLNELRQQNSKLLLQLDGEKKGFEEKIKRELGALKEQLQVHIQTIGILVAEKTELQSSLNQSLKQAEARLEEIDELSGRLKASRQRVAELEKSYTTVSTSSNKHEKSSKELSKEVDRLKLDLYKMNKSNEEYQQQNSELQEKLQKKISQCGLMEDSVIELKGKLEMSELLVQQLQNSGGSVENSQQIEALLQEKGELAAKVEQFKEAFQKLSGERDQIVEQYQQYIDDLSAQSSSLQEQVKSLTGERDRLQEKQQELDAALSKMTAERETVTADTEAAIAEKARLTETLEKLKSDFQDLDKKYQAQIKDNSQLSRLVEERELTIQQLEMNIQQLSDTAVDRDSLLESMQSDKTALSRALAQNRELKNQLAELQNGFVKLSNDNMEMLSQLSSEQHVARELAARLGQQEDELKETREQLITKEQELTELQSRTHALSESQLSSQELDERMRQWEAQQTLLEHLQTELSSAQDAINSLTNQNSFLQAQVAEHKDEMNGNVTELSPANADMMESLNSSVRQLEMERNQVLEQLQEERHLRESVQSKLDSLRHDLATQTPATLNGDVISKAQFEALQHAMKQLEGKYTKAMTDKADLSDMKEQLEHQVLQLQGETDTIGEYITLYQQQRSILKQRQVEKDDYISRLARERTDMAEKLIQLQALVMQLLAEKQNLQGIADISQEIIPNHAPHATTATPGKPLGGKLDSSQLDDWPDYTSSDSDTSEVEAIMGGAQSSDQQQTQDSKNKITPQKQPHTSPKHHSPQSPSSTASQWPADQTAQKIMHLLTEIGTSNLVDPHYNDNSFLHCVHCRGPLLNV